MTERNSKLAGVAVAALIVLCGAFGEGSLAQDAESAVRDKARSGQAAKYRDDTRKRREYNRCLLRALPECRKKQIEAMDWCVKHWQECLPLIRGYKTNASAYGEQESEKCRNEVRGRCAKEADK